MAICFTDLSTASASVCPTPMSSRSGMGMGKTSGKVLKFGEISPQVLGERVNRFLRAKYPSNTAKNVAADIPVKLATIRKWLEPAAAPSATHIGHLTYAYGAEFLVALYPGLAFLEAVASLARRETFARQLAAAETEFTRSLSQLMGAP